MKYDEDLYQWTIEQGRALRDRATNALDYDNLAEEIESLGRSDKREIESRLENLLVHLVKWLLPARVAERSVGSLDR